MTNFKTKNKELEKKITDYEKKVSWHLLLVFIVSGVLAHQVIFNMIYAGVLYNPALGDIAVKKISTQADDADAEPKVIAWEEGQNKTLRSIDGVPIILGIQTPQFFFVCVMTALGLVLFNIRSYLLKQFIETRKD